MEEKEALKRQIELLQNLINNHKSVHGDAPSARVSQWQSAGPVPNEGRGESTLIQPHSSQERPYNLQSPSHWRKTYSLRNKISHVSVKHSSSAASSVTSAKSTKAVGITVSSSLPSQSSSHSTRGESDRTKMASVSSEGQGRRECQNIRIAIDSTGARSRENLTQTGRGAFRGGREVGIRVSASTGSKVPEQPKEKQMGDVQLRSAVRTVILPREADPGSAEVPCASKTNPVASVRNSTQLQIKPCLPVKTSTAAKQTPAVADPSKVTTGNSTLHVLTDLSSLPAVSEPSFACSISKPPPAQLTASPLRRSKFTWVKSQDPGAAGLTQGKSERPSLGKSIISSFARVSNDECINLSSSSSTSSSSSLSYTVKRTSSRKTPRKLCLATGNPKNSKYTWVSSSACSQAKLSRKPPSPRALAVAQRATEKGEAMRKLKPSPAQSTKQRKGVGDTSASSSASSHYRWKAGGQSATDVGAGGATVAPRGSAFHWRSDRICKVGRGALSVPQSVAQRAFIHSSSSPGGFKLRSRMKIIRRTVSSGLERRASPPAVMAYSRTHTLTRSPVGMKKTPSRELVSFGRHKLRRLSPTTSRTGHASSSHRSPASQRVFRTRYKMVTRTGVMSHYSPTLSWRAKRIHSARSLLQSRLRSPQDRHSPSQPWRGRRDMRWIGGSLYRVSANKLSRTVSVSTPINRTGRWHSPYQVAPATSPLWRPSNTRHVASRAVQRSLAIIRHARQKKQQRQYCMYYNRFGKCNRGNSCPYIHDPDKVAVCTRFLRGTCKQTDGTCPFSHKVAKEKMPVCSYFLKGICNNSSCPYSHVYVSRKAAVCQDFIKGYCPQGEKCKKKHTLVCPDFSRTGSCPQGSQCKLQHRQKAKRSAPGTPTLLSPSTTSTAQAKKGRTKDTAKRPRLSVVIPLERAEGSQADPGTPTSGPQKLPSFISLSSSPEDIEVPDTPPAQTTQVTERKLQIKPRL